MAIGEFQATHVAIYLTLLFAYIGAAYVAGAQLNRLQLIIANTLFIGVSAYQIAIIASASLGTLAVGYAGLLLLGIIEADIALLDVRALFEHIATILAMNPLLLYGCLGVLGVVLLFSLGFQTKSYIAWNAKQQKGTSRN